MEKPLTIKRAEFSQRLADAINESELPAFVVADILERVTEHVKRLANEQFMNDKQAYEQACADEAKEE